jgi:hypothetical protein
MKNITLKIGLTVLLLILAGSVYSQTAVANLVRLTSINPAGGGTTSIQSPLSIVSQDDSTISIDASGVVTVGSDYTPTAASGNTTGVVGATTARSKTISVRLNTGSTVDLNAGATFGAITSAPGVGGIQRASDGGIGVTLNGASSGIDNGEGLTFGLDLSSLPTTLSVEISAVYFSTFGTTESCTVVNRQDPTKSLTVTGFATTNSGTRDISGLGILIPGGTAGFIDAVSFFSPNATSSFRITGIEFKIVQPVNNLIILNSLTGSTTVTPNGSTSLPGPPIVLVSQDDSNISINAAGVVTIESDYARTATQTVNGTTFTTGVQQEVAAKSKTFAIRLSAGSGIDQTAGATLGAITTTGGIQRASDGGIGVTTTGGSSGIDNGKGINFSFDLSSLPSTLSVEITAVYFSTFGTAESCTVVNRQDPTKNLTVTGFSGNAGTRDISGLGLLVSGGTAGFTEAVSFFSPNAASNFRITGIEFRIVQPVNNLIILNSLTGSSTITPNGTTSVTGTIVSQDDSNIAVSASGSVSIESDYSRTASQTISGTTFATGIVQVGGAKSKTFSVRLTAGSVIDQTVGATLGAITTAAGMHRASDGGIGVTTDGNSSGIDNGEGINFGFDLSSLSSSVALQITSVYLSTFGTAETCTVVNRQDTSKSVALAGFGSNLGNRDISTLDIIIPGGTVDLDAVSFFSPNAASNFRITGIECKIIVLSNVWNGTAWSNVTPAPTVNAVIEGNYSTTTRGSFSALKLTVNSGSLTIDATKTVKVENEVINNAGLNGIVVNSGGGLIQVVNSTNANVGEITVKRDSNPLLRLDYTMWSSPVSGTQTLAQFSPLTSQSPNRFYTYDSATDFYANVAPTTILDATNAGKGFLIRMPNTADAATPTAYSGVFTGLPNSGPITLSDLTANKYYSVGNPYPSVLSASLFLAGNPLADTTLYFWRETNGTANTLTGSSTGTSYATWTSLASTASGTVAPNNIAPSANIAVGQGFIVNTGTATSLNFTNTMRPNSSTANFLKTKEEVAADRVWLNLTNTKGVFSQTVIGYLDGATLGVDKGIDGIYINDSPVALTSNINNKEYTIQGRPAFDASDVVALNFKTVIAGDYTIAIDHFDGLFATGQNIYLKDNKTGAETDLKAGAYNFTATAGVDNTRFLLKYQKSLKVIDSEFNDNSVTVYAKEGTLYVNSGASAIDNIKVFDIQGRLIAEQKNLKSTTATISNLSVNQALIVQVSSEDNKVVSKKIVN